MPVFLAPLYLLAGLAAAIPIAIHLLHRRRPRPVPFSTLRFLQEAVARTRRSRNVTHIIALLFRVLIILLLACAFARPKVQFATWLPEGARTVILVLDCTASMQFMDGDKSNFETAREWARKLLASLNEADQVAVVAAGAKDPWVLFPPVSDHAAAVRALDDLQPGYGTAQLTSILRELVHRFDESSVDKGAEIHVFSDFQETGWNSVEAEDLARELARRQTVVFLNHVRPEVVANAGIEDAIFHPPALLGNGRFTAIARVVSSPDYRGPNSLRLHIDGAEISRTTFTLRPAQTLEQSIESRAPDGEGAVTGTLELEKDALEADNVFYFSLARFPGIPVLLVDGSARGPGSATQDTLFLRYALQPRGRVRTLFLPRIVDWATFLSTDPRRFRVLFLSNPPELSTTAAMKIKQFLNGGGTVVVFPGAFAALEKGWAALPGLKGANARKVTLDEEKAVSLLRSESPDEIEKRLVQIIPDKPAFVLRRRLLFDGIPSDATGVWQYADGKPFIFTVRVGRGRLWVASVSANRDWSDWPLTPWFVVFIQELGKQAASQRLPVLTGRIDSPLAIPWEEDALEIDLRVSGPAGARMVSVKRRDPADPVVLDGFDRPGVYRIEHGGLVRKVAVNLPKDECRMTFVGREEAAFSLRAASVYQAGNWEELQQRLADVRIGRPVWPVLLALAFFLALTEELFANFRSRAAGLPEALRQFLRRGGRAV